MGRSRISERGRRKRGRGQGEGADWKTWVKPTDFSSASGSTLVPHPEQIGRKITTFPPWETHIVYELLWRRNVIEFKEQYPIPLEVSLEACRLLEIKHPYDHFYKEYRILTVDFLAELSNDGCPGTLAIDFSRERDAARVRKGELLEVHRKSMEMMGYEYELRHEVDVPVTLAKNVRLIIKGHDLTLFPTLRRNDVVAWEPILYDRIINVNEPLCVTCGMWDERCGLFPGSTLIIVWHLLWLRKWEVDMNVPIKPIINQLHLSQRNEGWSCLQ